MSDTTSRVKDLAVVVKELKQQREELLAALKRAWAGAPEGPYADRILAAIAKAEANHD